MTPKLLTPDELVMFIANPSPISDLDRRMLLAHIAAQDALIAVAVATWTTYPWTIPEHEKHAAAIAALAATQQEPKQCPAG